MKSEYHHLIRMLLIQVANSIDTVKKSVNQNFFKSNEGFLFARIRESLLGTLPILEKLT